MCENCRHSRGLVGRAKSLVSKLWAFGSGLVALRRRSLPVASGTYRSEMVLYLSTPKWITDLEKQAFEMEQGKFRLENSETNLSYALLQIAKSQELP